MTKRILIIKGTTGAAYRAMLEVISTYAKKEGIQPITIEVFSSQIVLIAEWRIVAYVDENIRSIAGQSDITSTTVIM